MKNKIENKIEKYKVIHSDFGWLNTYTVKNYEEAMKKLVAQAYSRSCSLNYFTLEKIN